MQEIAQSQNVIFSKIGCPFCLAANKLLEKLVEAKVLEGYQTYTLDVDYENETLGDLANLTSWKPDGGQSYPSKPQIFINGNYIGGNFEFYQSIWNIGENMPNLKNPMRF
jgi:glutaredoxin 1